MKNLHQYMLILVAGVLGACGSMSVNEPYAEALPADFNPQEYLTLHPELHMAEIKDYVEDYNSQVKANYGNEYKALKDADEKAFIANKDVLKAIYLHPQIGSHTEQQWNDLFEKLSLPDTTGEYKKARNVLVVYNLIGIDDDMSFLLAVPVDYQAVSQQFNVFGRDHGWAYRLCRPEESANPLRSSLPIAAEQENIVSSQTGTFIVDEGFYCRDAAGDDRLIQ
jgi:hypothetical protein